MSDALREFAPGHQSLDQLAAASEQLNHVKDKLERQQQEEAEKLRLEQEGKHLFSNISSYRLLISADFAVCIIF